MAIPPIVLRRLAAGANEWTTGQTARKGKRKDLEPQRTDPAAGPAWRSGRQRPIAAVHFRMEFPY
jgi:hypothetical protein